MGEIPSPPTLPHETPSPRTIPSFPPPSHLTPPISAHLYLASSLPLLNPPPHLSYLLPCHCIVCECCSAVCACCRGQSSGVVVCEAGAGSIKLNDIYGNEGAAIQIRSKGNPEVRTCLPCPLMASKTTKKQIIFLDSTGILLKSSKKQDTDLQSLNRDGHKYCGIPHRRPSALENGPYRSLDLASLAKAGLVPSHLLSSSNPVVNHCQPMMSFVHHFSMMC